MIVAGKYGDKGKVMDFIFPRLMIKMWNEVVDVNLCYQDKFVVRGDATPDDFSQEVSNMKNVMIVSRTSNEAIKVERIGECFGRMFQLEEEMERLFVEFRKYFGVILSHNQANGRNFELELKCSTCEEDIGAQSLVHSEHLDEVSEHLWHQEVCQGCKKAYTAVERVGNLSELARVFYLLRAFGNSKKLEEELGDFVNFPRNQIVVADNEHRRFFKGKTIKHLSIQRKLQLISEKEAVFDCCFVLKSAVMVSKYLKCRMIDCSYSEEPRYVRALKNLGRELFVNKANGRLPDISHFLEKITVHHENVEEVGQQICLLLEGSKSEGANNAEVLELKQAISFLSEENGKEMKAFEVFLTEVQRNKVVYSSFVAGVENLKTALNSVERKPMMASSSAMQLLEPCSFAKFFYKFHKLKKIMSRDFRDLFHKELQQLMKEVQEMKETWQKVRSVVEMITKVYTLIARAKEMEVTKTLRLQRNKFHRKKGAMFSDVTLHSFEDQYDADSNHPPKSVIVDLKNIFGSPLHFPQFAVRSGYFNDDIHYYGPEIKDRLFLFLQICCGVRELKNLGIVHRNIQLKNTAMHANSKWVCLSGFDMAIKCPTEEMILSAEVHQGVCGTQIVPPELKFPGPIKMDKFDVFCLGWVIQDLIALRITNWKGKEVKSEVIELLGKVQKRMVCEYHERMEIEEVIGVLEWILYSKTETFGLYPFKVTNLATKQMWECQSKQEIQEKQKNIIMAGVGEGARFCMEEWMEIMFILTFTLEKQQQIEKCVNELMGRGPNFSSVGLVKLAAGPKDIIPEGYSDKEFNHFIFLIKNLNNIPLEKLAVKGILGLGCNGIVWLVEADLRGQRVELALKMLYNYTRTAIQRSNLKNIDREFDTLSSCPLIHKNIVQILSKFIAEPTREMMAHLAQLNPDVIEDMMEENKITKQSRPATTQFFLIEYHPVTLQQKLDKLARKLTWQEIYKYARDLLSASLFLFNNHVVHRDIKLDNILVSGDDHLVLADFGESMQTDKNHCAPKENLTAANPLHTSPEVDMAIQIGSPIINFSGQYSWETGCVIYEIVEGIFPFPFPVVEGGKPHEFTQPSAAKVELLELIKKMIKVNPKERISIQDAWNEFKDITV